MAINKNTKAIKLIMSHYKDVLKKDGLPVKYFKLHASCYKDTLWFYIGFSKELSKDSEKKLNIRVKEFARALGKEHAWLECEEDYLASDDKLSVSIECDVNYPTYNDISI